MPAPRPRARLWPRLLLSLLAVGLTLGALEGVTRWAVAPPRPVHLRDHIYVSLLPLIAEARAPPQVDGAPLPREKRHGETRVFVFGESSVEGAPWHHFGSPPTLLHDQLRTHAPGRDLTVVNMGRGGAVLRDTWYFEQAIVDLAPDIIVLYQGVNDNFSFSDPELCAPVRSPHLHAAWRWLIGHSRLAWTLRTQVRHRVARTLPTAPELPTAPAESCNSADAFAAWADVVVQAAVATGARVLVTTPVENPLRAAETDVDFRVDQPLAILTRPPHYGRLLACLLEPSCDRVAAWQAASGPAQRARGIVAGPGANSVGTWRRPWVQERGAAWRAAASRHGAVVLDFDAELQQELDGGLRGEIFLEDVHLTLTGAWRLAWLWTRAVVPIVAGAAASTLPAAPPPLDTARYLADIAVSPETAPACTLLRVAHAYLRLNMPLIAGPILHRIVRDDRGSAETLARSRAGLLAQLLLGSLRQRVGLAPGVPAVLRPRLDRVTLGEPTLGELTLSLQARRDCATVGGALLDDIAPALPGPQAERRGTGQALTPVAALLASLPADVSMTGVAPDDAVHAHLGGAATGVRLIVMRRPADGQAHGGVLLDSLLVLTDPRSPPAEAEPLVAAALRRLRSHDTGQYPWQAAPGRGARQDRPSER